MHVVVSWKHSRFCSLHQNFLEIQWSECFRIWRKSSNGNVYSHWRYTILNYCSTLFLLYDLMLLYSSYVYVYDEHVCVCVHNAYKVTTFNNCDNHHINITSCFLQYEHLLFSLVIFCLLPFFYMFSQHFQAWEEGGRCCITRVTFLFSLNSNIS